MFRFLFRRNKRGKGDITTPEKMKSSDEPVAIEEPKMQVTTKTFQILKPVLIVSAFIGYTHQSYRIQGCLGGLLWLTMLLAHGALDFLAARQVYTYGWASVSLSLFFVCFVCTIFSNRKLLPWLEKGLSRLEEDGKYPKTLERFGKVFKWLPLFILLFGLFCGAGIYICLYVDNTLDVKIDLNRTTSEVPEYALVILKAVRFIAACYVMSAMALFWSLGVCVMNMTGYSMTEFHDEIRSHLMNRDSPITFRQAVVSFTERGKFVKKSASACRVSLAILLVYSITSLAVNAFLFLYKNRHSVFAIYALLPSITAIYPLCMAAWVTKQYQWYLAVVVKAWAERPESSSEEEENETRGKNANQTNQRRGRSLWKRVSSARKGSRKKPLKETNSLPLASPTSDSESKSGVEELPKSARQHASETHLAAPTSEPEPSEDEKPIVKESRQHASETHLAAPTSEPEPSEDEKPIVKESVNNRSDGEQPKRSRREVMDLVLRGAAKVVGKLRHNAKKPKFNFEKYISYLQNVLHLVGFDIMGIVVTWNMVSTIIFLEVSVLALFVQESIFGNSKATVAL